MVNKQEQKDDQKKQVIAVITSLPYSARVELWHELKTKGIIK